MTSKIKPSYFYNLYRPSKCDLRLYLQLKGVEPAPPSAFEQVLFRLGQRHEKNHLFTFPEFTDLTGKPSKRTLKEIRKAGPHVFAFRFHRARVSHTFQRFGRISGDI